MRRQNWSNLSILTILLIAFALRLYRLDQQSFAFDEGWTSYAIHHSWTEMWRVLTPDNHPPLSYVLIKAFAELAGYGDFGVRSFSVGCGMALIAGVYALGRRLGGGVGGLSAAAFATCSPLLIYYAQEARMYSLLMALAVLSTYGLARLIDAPRDRRWWALYAVTACGALYTHYFAALLILAQSVVALIGLTARRQARWLGRWFLGQGAILILYLPWLPTAVRQVLIGQGTWWRMPLPTSVILKDIWRFFILGPRRPMGVPVFGTLMGSVALAVLVAVLLGWRRDAVSWSLALVTFVVPVGAVVLIGSNLPIYTDRYALVAAPGLALIVGLGASACWNALPGKRAWIGRGAGIVVLASALIAPLPQLNAVYHDPAYWREDFRRAAQFLMDKSEPGDTVVLVGSSQPIMQYYRGPAEVLIFPQEGDSVQDEQEVVSSLRKHVNPGRDVRVVMYSWPTVDPQALVEGQLRTNCELRGEHWQSETGQRPIRVMNFGACDADFVVEPRDPIDAIWGDQVALRAYRLDHFAPGRLAHVVMWWQTLRHPDQDYSVFVHLLDAQGQMIKQFDKLPLSDFYPMRAWPLQADQRDDYPLYIRPQADLEGAWLAIGLYDSRTEQRLPVSKDGIPVGDYLRIPLAR
ncbi:MAG: glycosyltransferase family 39 protein [Anaerolineae bacterium]|nr:glycosyltransferase family 39 protein [Anaerolineae bacterium]